MFALLYKLINMDSVTGDEPDLRFQVKDSPSDAFRVRLVCTILNALNKPVFAKHKRRLLMDRFLIFFLRYVNSKEYLLMDLEIELLDTLEAIRPKQ
jgi:regulator of nonsense transcripts 2